MLDVKYSFEKVIGSVKYKEHEYNVQNFVLKPATWATLEVQDKITKIIFNSNMEMFKNMPEVNREKSIEKDIVATTKIDSQAYKAILNYAGKNKEIFELLINNGLIVALINDVERRIEKDILEILTMNEVKTLIAEHCSNFIDLI